MIITDMQQFDLRDYIKLKRVSKKISLNNFAIKNGLTAASLSRIENKKYELKYTMLEKIAKGFSMSPGEFLIEYENYLKNGKKPL